MSDVRLSDVCIAAVADLFRNDGEIMVSPMAPVPAVAARLAKKTFAPELVLTDGFNKIIANVAPYGVPDPDQVVEGWMPFRKVFDTLWWGKRHVIMGATQVDQYGNQNISCIGDFQKPKVQLLGSRGAPGNTISHTTSYWVPKHTKHVFVPKVDVVSGLGYDNAAKLPEVTRARHEIRAVVSNLGVFDFQTDDHRMRIRSIHPGVKLDDVIANTGFELIVPADLPETRTPTADEVALIRALDPKGIADKELGA
ncbi:MAG: CoA-transferase [Myxococcales bacterium]|jgi:acyl CoA:acetate/3-ketoacid CoA transferase beta subunit|nr:CoA-transferase [Myxococcales bacterium]